MQAASHRVCETHSSFFGLLQRLATFLLPTSLFTLPVLFFFIAQATEKDSTGMIDYTEFCEILQVGGYPHPGLHRSPESPDRSDIYSFVPWLLLFSPVFSRESRCKYAIIADPLHVCVLAAVVWQVLRRKRSYCRSFCDLSATSSRSTVKPVFRCTSVGTTAVTWCRHAMVLPFVPSVSFNYCDSSVLPASPNRWILRPSAKVCSSCSTWTGRGRSTSESS